MEKGSENDRVVSPYSVSTHLKNLDRHVRLFSDVSCMIFSRITYTFMCKSKLNSVSFSQTGMT